MTESEATTESERSPRPSLGDRIRLAASFLTIIPALDQRPRSAEEVAASFGWFPLIGFAIGAMLCAEDYVLRAIAGGAARAIVIVMTLAALTGAVHLDGLGDTADALGAGRDRDRALTIMRDSRIGAFGAIAIFFALIIKLSVIANLTGVQRYTALFLAPGLARWAMVAVAQRMIYLRAVGAGTALLQEENDAALRTASAIAIAGIAIAHSILAVRGALIAIVIVIALRTVYRRWLGGVTGDLIGAAGEIVETAIMVAIAS
jgi:adenosylcobinamide-GDP ribazoletransferase